MMLTREMDRFGNKVLARGGEISKFGTVLFMTIGQEFEDPANLLYSDGLLEFRKEPYRAQAAGNGLNVFVAEGISAGIILGKEIHFVSNMARFKVMAGGLLARIKEGRRIYDCYRRDLPIVRRALLGVKPPYCSERDFLMVDAALYRDIVMVLKLGNPHFPEYRVFNNRTGKRVFFNQCYPLSRAVWGK